MDKINLLAMRYRDYLASCDALQFLGEGIITGFCDSQVDRNQCHVTPELFLELSKEAGSDVRRERFTKGNNLLYFYYRDIKFFALERVENVLGTP